MKVLLFGLGSIGTRHARNAHALGHHVIAADPMCLAPEPNGTVTMFYRSWETMLSDHADTAQAAIIASPTAAHYDQARAVLSVGLPVYLEKPAVAVADVDAFRAMIKQAPLNYVMRSCIGFQYMFHPNIPQVSKLARSGYLHFEGKDRLLSRYGKDVGGVMVAHPIHTALHFLGPAMSVHITSNGVQLSGLVLHGGGAESYYNFDMDCGPRQSWVRSGGRGVELEPSDSMYVDYLRAWLDQVTTGDRDPRLATLMDGLRVSEVLSRVQLVELEPS